LRADAIAHELYAVIAQATGLAPSISLKADSVAGQIVEIVISGIAPSDRPAYATHIANIMSRYTFSYRIEWR
jgi:hypothetical protein